MKKLSYIPTSWPPAPKTPEPVEDPGPESQLAMAKKRVAK